MLDNKVYLDDFIEATEPRDEALLHQALLFSGAVRELWRRSFPTISVTMVVSMAETLFEDEPNYIDGTWRLHRLRPGESWLAGDLDDYETESVLRIDPLASEVRSGSVAQTDVSATASRPR